jgi:hypothetical protein
MAKKNVPGKLYLSRLTATLQPVRLRFVNFASELPSSGGWISLKLFAKD